MRVTAEARDVLAAATDLLLIPVTSIGDKKGLPGRLSGLNRALEGGVNAAIASGDFSGQRDQKLVLYPDGAIPRSASCCSASAPTSRRPTSRAGRRCTTRRAKRPRPWRPC